MNFFISEEEKRRGVAEQYYKREADWKEAGEERSDERAGIFSDNIRIISVTKSSKERSDELGEATSIIRNILYY